MVHFSFFTLVCAIFGKCIFVASTNTSTDCCSLEPVVYHGVDLPDSCLDVVQDNETVVSLSCGTTSSLKHPELQVRINEKSELEIDMANGDPNYMITIETGEYCISNQSEVINGTKKTEVVLCNNEEKSSVVDSVLPYFMLLSTTFLLLTAAVYAALPELRDLQGKSIVSFCLALAIGLCLLAMMTLVSYTRMDWCAVRGFLMYYFLIASFFWTNAISIQIALSVRNSSLVNNMSWREFMYYSVYAWGCPVLMTMCTAIVNYHPGDHLRPGIGLNHCWFFDKTQQWIYLYSVMTILILANTGIFIYVSIVLWRSRFSSTHIKAMKYKFFMTLKLSILMGLPWIFEMISSLTEYNFFWDIMDIFNLGQGPLIFLILVVLRRKTLKALYRHGYLFCLTARVEKYLAEVDDEEDNVAHTLAFSMDEKSNAVRN